MADKSFGVKELNLLNASGTPTVTSPNNLNLNANTVAISTSATVGNNLTVTSTTNSANLNVTGVGTLTRAFATDLSVSGISTISQPSNTNAHSLWLVTANGSSAYRFTGPGQDGSDDDPDIYLVRGQRYIFTNNSGGSHPFQIRVASGGAAYSTGVTNNGGSSGNIIFNVQHDAPAQLFYQCTSHSGMVGNIYIVGGPQVISGVVTATTFVGNLTGNVTGTASANAVLTGSTNNQLVTVTGANAITGESGLTYNGTRLDVTTGDLQVIGGEGGNAELRIVADQGDDGADYWRFQSAASGNNLNIATYASGAWVDKVSITSGGDVCINSTGLSSPYTAFRNLSINNNLILNAQNSAGGFAGMQNNAYLNSSGNWVRVNNDHATSIGTDDGNFYFRNAGAGTGNITWSQRLNILANGNIGINRTSPSSLLHIQGNDTSTYNINSAVTNGILTISSDAGGGVGKCVGLQFNGPCSNGEGYITMVGISNSEMDMHFGMRSGNNRGDKVIFSSNGRVRCPEVYSTNGSSMRDVQIESDGTLCAGNTSVRASKLNIISQTDISWLYDLNPVTFNYRKKIVDKVTGIPTYFDEAESETSYGLIAEEVETVKKDFCFYNDDKLEGVHYNRLITPLLKAIQDQKKEIDDLKAEVAALKGS